MKRENKRESKHSCLKVVGNQSIVKSLERNMCKQTHTRLEVMKGMLRNNTIFFRKRHDQDVDIRNI